MTTQIFIFLSLITLPAMAQSQQPKDDSGKTVVHEVTLQVVEDEIEPPPPHLITKFKSLQEWLTDIFENDKPKKSIAKYKFALFESPNNYTIALIGVNTYNERQNRSVTRIEFEPANMYFKLPEKEFENLNRSQLTDKLTSQLKDLANTERFRNSFFTKANVVDLETNGQIIWQQ